MSTDHGHYAPGFSNFFKNPQTSLKHAFSEMSDPGHIIGHMLLLHPVVNAVTIGTQSIYDAMSGIPYRGPKTVTEFVGKLLHFKFSGPKDQKQPIEAPNTASSSKVLIDPKSMPSNRHNHQQYSQRSPIVMMPQ